MATLQQIYVNLLTGCFTASFSFGLFGLAIRFGFNNQVAPRSWSRPPEILKNVLKPPFAFKWISWSRKLIYPDLMAGIPGTGTRNKGFEGPPLRVNLDGIIMLKYHVLLLKISLLATLLCLLIVLPLTTTADCDVSVLGSGTCDLTEGLTDFEATTIANIPPLRYNSSSTESEDITHVQKFWVDNTTSRYLGIALVALIIYWYTCHMVWKEWIENLALRRVFFLEHDHYAERLEELYDMTVRDPPEQPLYDPRKPWLPHPELRENVPNISLYSCLYQLPNQMKIASLSDKSDLDKQLEAAVDFFNLCVPNQPGFSSSVAAVTLLPEPSQVALAWKKWYFCGKRLRKLRYIRSLIQRHVERQQREDAGLPVVNEEQPKQSNQINVVINTPSYTNMEVISTKTTELEMIDTEESKKNNPHAPLQANLDTRLPSHSLRYEVLANDPQTTHEGLSATVAGPNFGNQQSNDQPHDLTLLSTGVESLEISTEIEFCSDASHERCGGDEISAPLLEEKAKFSYANFDSNQFARSIGFDEETKLGNLVSDIDIEQISVYAREYAQSSSNACPFGCGEKMLLFANLEKLRQLEEETIKKVQEANAELVAARELVNQRKSDNDGAQNDSELCNPSQTKKNEHTSALLASSQENPLAQAATGSIRQRRTVDSNKWQQAQALASEMYGRESNEQQSKSSCGNACIPTGNGMKWMLTNFDRGMLAGTDVGVPLMQAGSVLEHPTYAVITFTSRQAAVAARQCLVDGSGIDRWVEIEEVGTSRFGTSDFFIVSYALAVKTGFNVKLPVAPLADAVPWDVTQCRGCCRPVTLTISEREKKVRRFFAVTIFLLFCFGYTIPLALTSKLLNPSFLAATFPNSEALQDQDSFFFRVLSGISSGFLYTIFFSFCPQLFKAIANFEGNVSSKRTADDKALTYFWYFMMLTAFTGTALAQMLAEVFVDSASLGTELKGVLVGVANSIPTQQAPVWMNWLIVRFSYTLPFLYMFQANTFGFDIIKWPWCSRLMRGGGPGGPPPYRIYVDSGTAFMCVVAISPVCPLIAPLALIYFAVILVMLRWLLVFVYRPWYDTGGNKWPALHEIIISSMIYGQVLLVTILILRNAIFPGSLIFVSIIPTYLFSRNCKDKFLRSYNDAGLLQTSQLDGWGDHGRFSKREREEFRRWLVDCHKASYVPICLAGSDAVITVEPAVVTPIPGERLDREMPLLMKKQRGARFARFEK